MTIGSSCILLVPDDTVKTGRKRPQMLEDMMYCPVLGWMIANLLCAGADRFFIVCHPQYADLVRRCLPPDVSAVISTNQDTSDQLHVFLSTADEREERVLVVTGPAILAQEAPARADAPGASGVMSVDRQTLMDALDDSFHFYDFLQQHGTPLTQADGVFAVDHRHIWQEAFRRQFLRELTQRGVAVWDEAATFVTPTVRIGVGTELLPGTILCGSTAIGADCTIGPYAMLSDTTVGDACRIGTAQLSGCQIGSRASVGAYCALEQVTLAEDAAVSSGSCLRDCVIAAASPAEQDGGTKAKSFFKRK